MGAGLVRSGGVWGGSSAWLCVWAALRRERRGGGPGREVAHSDTLRHASGSRQEVHRYSVQRTKKIMHIQTQTSS